MLMLFRITKLLVIADVQTNIWHIESFLDGSIVTRSGESYGPLLAINIVIFGANKAVTFRKIVFSFFTR